MGFNLMDYVTEGSDRCDFEVIGYAVRRLTDDLIPEIIKLIPDEKSLLDDLDAVTDILNLYCALIDQRHRIQEADHD